MRPYNNPAIPERHTPISDLKTMSYMVKSNIRDSSVPLTTELYQAGAIGGDYPHHPHMFIMLIVSVVANMFLLFLILILLIILISRK